MRLCENPNKIFFNTKKNKWEFLTEKNFDKFTRQETHQILEIPCGKCKTCLTNKSFEYYQRNLLEFSTSKTAYFITLTYDQKNLKSKSVNIKELQDFTKRVRKELYNNFKIENCKYFGVSEYGDKTLRPHYHIIFYNIPLRINDFTKFKIIKTKHTDEYIYKWTINKFLNDNNFTNKKIKELWGKGNITIAPLNQARINYVVSYLFKEINTRTKETINELNKKGIELPKKIQSTNLGFSKLEENKDKFLNQDYIYINGTKIYANKYIDEKLDISSEERTMKRIIARIDKQFNVKEKSKERINNKKGYL